MKKKLMRGYHAREILEQALVVSASAAFALTLPYLLHGLARTMPFLSAAVQDRNLILLALEVSAAAGLALLFNFLRRHRSERKLARIAATAGLVAEQPSPRDRRNPGRKIKFIGSTGLSLTRTDGKLLEAMQNCREAKIMLLDPREHGALVWARQRDPKITAEVIRERVLKSIDAIKKLRVFNRTVRLKLYPDIPLLRMAIIGDYAYVRHYHTDTAMRSSPEFVVRNIKHHGGFYIPLNRYFVSRWHNPDVPEYDLETDELVYRDAVGYEVLREPFDGITIVYERGNEGEAVSRSVFR